MSIDRNKNSKDEYLRTAIIEAFTNNELLAALSLRVGVLNTIAHLGGSAPSQEQWNEADRVAAAIPGVRGVVNRIEAPGAPEPARTIDLNLKDYPPGKNETRVNAEQID